LEYEADHDHAKIIKYQQPVFLPKVQIYEKSM